MRFTSAGLFSTFVFALLSGIFLTGCSRPEAPVFQSLANLELKDPGMKESTVSADVRYYNPNGYPLKFKKGELSVYINDHFVGKSELDTLIVIPARDTFSIPVSMKLKMQDLLSNTLGLLLTHELGIKLEGYARLGRSGIFINVPIHYEGRQKVEF
ncbi:MAG: LEA type 2 family protein [Bacteroidetes bacterium]|nr:LEA type 2 family protein [Bacteroidota bacterium]